VADIGLVQQIEGKKALRGCGGRKIVGSQESLLTITNHMKLEPVKWHYINIGLPGGTQTVRIAGSIESSRCDRTRMLTVG
jgi:hypothetical protein